MSLDFVVHPDLLPRPRTDGYIAYERGMREIAQSPSGVVVLGMGRSTTATLVPKDKRIYTLVTAGSDTGIVAPKSTARLAQLLETSGSSYRVHGLYADATLSFAEHLAAQLAGHLGIRPTHQQLEEGPVRLGLLYATKDMAPSHHTRAMMDDATRIYRQ